MSESTTPGVPHDAAAVPLPDIDAIRARRETIAPWIVETPVTPCPALEDEVGNDTRVLAKLEFLQRTGTFKARGALSVLTGLDAAARERGVTACSAGNHAIAVAYAARVTGSNAKVVMIDTANPVRVRRCRDFGAEVVLVAGVHEAFEAAERIAREEGRFFVQPFEGADIALGTATLGLEICRQVADFEAIVIPIGGGGLCAGVASAVRQLNPDCRILGVEPEGADTMSRSLKAGEPQGIDEVRSIADSLGAPFALPYSFELCRQTLDEVVRVSDDELRQAMRLLFHRQKIAVEPACAASTAALVGPLRTSLAGRRAVLVMCGSNIDWPSFAACLPAS